MQRQACSVLLVAQERAVTWTTAAVPTAEADEGGAEEDEEAPPPAADAVTTSTVLAGTNLALPTMDTISPI